MKNCMKILIAVVLVLSCLSSGAMAVEFNDAAREITDKKIYDVLPSLRSAAEEITGKKGEKEALAYADQLSFEDGKPFTRLKVWSKGKTIVTGDISYNGLFSSLSLMTADPKLTFTGGIRVGASTKVLEKLFGAPMKKIAFAPGIVYAYSDPDIGDQILCIFYKNGKITEIYGQWWTNRVENFFSVYDDDYFVDEAGYDAYLSRGTIDFIKKTRKKLGFPNSKVP